MQKYRHVVSFTAALSNGLRGNWKSTVRKRRLEESVALWWSFKINLLTVQGDPGGWQREKYF